MTAPAPPTAATDNKPAAAADKQSPLLRHIASWVPIRSLGARHKARIEQHLLSLGERDRYLRFGYAATDEQIGRYVSSLDFKQDEVLGIFNRRLQLVAMAHLAYAPAPQRAGKPAMAEFGVSVTKQVRGRGFGARLFERAALQARNRGVETLFIHALTENAPMLKIARNAGAKVEREGSESEAWLRLPEDTVSSHVGEAIERHMAEVDFQFKRNARTFHDLIAGISGIAARLGFSASKPADDKRPSNER